MATKKARYLAEALISADSAKRRCPSLPITLFTDNINDTLCSATCFDNVIAIDDLGIVASTWAGGKLARIHCLRLTPYEYTLHIDTDTQILTDELPRLFHILDEEADVAMVETSLDDSYSRSHYGRRMFNNGLVLYRRNALVWKCLEEWFALSERNFRLAASTDPLPSLPGMEHVKEEKVLRHLLGSDQVALVEILSPEVNKFGLKVKTLDYSWNHRGSMQKDKNVEAPRILHYLRRLVDPRAAFESAVNRRILKPRPAAHQ